MTYAFLAFWALLFAFPPTVRGKRAKHNAAVIWKPEGPLNSDGSTTEYVHVQEKGEYRLHKIIGLTAGLVAALLLPATLIGALSVAIITAAFDSLSRKIGAIDYAGHGAEIIAAENDGDWSYRAAEIKRMSDDGDKQGHDVPAQLDRWEWLARIVCRLGK